jgi:Ca-activated chloride channel family protein
MKRSQLTVAIVAVFAIGLIYVLTSSGGGGGDDKKSGSTDAVQKAPKGALVVSFGYSPEKEPLLKPLIAKYNAEKHQIAGKQVFVEATNISSGDAEQKIAKGTYKPVAWSPASSLWGRLLNFEADQPYVPDDNPSIVRTPLVIAMWEPMAQALGYPKKQIGWSDILKLAQSNQGWAAYGKPQFGAFKLVHTNPDFSTAGLSSVVAEYYAAPGKKEGLTEKDVSGAGARDTVKAIEHSIVHYGDTTLFISDQLRKEGPGYASAVALEEATLVDFNNHRGSQPKLIGIYPKEGTFYSDDPYITLNAPWVTAEQKQASDAFQKFLAKEVDPATAAKAGFRPGDLHQKPLAPIDAAHGADPAQPTRVLGLPEPRVLDLIRRSWREDRKPANVLLVLDVSGSMNEENRLERAKDGLQTFLKSVSPNDRVGLTIFSDRIEPLLPIAPVSQDEGKLKETIDSLIADGGTAIYDATANGVETVKALNDKERINAVVLLTDGEDTDSDRTIDEIEQELEAQGDSSSRVRVFTIAYSAGAEGAADGLRRIAEASGGKAYEGNTEDIEAVYRSISSFF